MHCEAILEGCDGQIALGSASPRAAGIGRRATANVLTAEMGLGTSVALELTRESRGFCLCGGNYNRKNDIRGDLESILLKIFARERIHLCSANQAGTEVPRSNA